MYCYFDSLIANTSADEKAQCCTDSSKNSYRPLFVRSEYLSIAFFADSSHALSSHPLAFHNAAPDERSIETTDSRADFRAFNRGFRII